MKDDTEKSLNVQNRNSQSFHELDKLFCSSNHYLGISQQTGIRHGKRIVVLKKPVSCCRRMNHAVLPCGLPFASPSLPCLLASLVHLSPLLHPCLNLLKCICGLTVLISHHATTVFMCHKCSIDIG